MKKTYRIGCVMLFLTLLLSAITACSGKGDTPDPNENTSSVNGGSSTSGTTGSGGTDEPEIIYDENGYELDDLPEELDFGDVDFRILTWSEWGKQDFMLEEGITWNEELYERQATIEDQLGVVIRVSQENGSWDYRASFLQTVENDLNANTTSSYDLILSYGASIGGITTRGYAANLHDFTYLNFNKPWWSDDQIEASSINGKLYFVSGDATSTTVQTICCIFGNENLLTSYGYNDLYDVVYEGESTLERKMETALGNVNFGDGGQNIYAMTIAASMQAPFLTAAGYKYLGHDEDGLICVAEDLNDLRVHNLFATLQEFVCDHEDVLINEPRTIFEQGSAFFHASQLSDMVPFVNSTDFGFIILPLPKYDTDQENYQTLCGSWNAYYCIPERVRNEDMSGAVLEALGSQGYRMVTPVVFEECLSLQFVSDPEDSAMVQFIYNTLTYDAAHVFASDAVGNLHTAFHGIIDPTASWTTIYNSNIDSWRERIMILNNNCK